MIKRVFGILAAGVFVFALAIVCIAQNSVLPSDKFVVSAKAGGVNIVLGEVMVERSGGRTGRLFKGDELQLGERVSTGADGRAEILMNPGSYLRLGSNSSFEFDSTDLDDVRIKIHSGSFIFEVFGAEQFTVDVKAGRSRFAFVDTGIYRVDIAADGDATVAIVKGRVLPALDITKTVKSGKKLDYDGTQFAVTKFDRNEDDDLARWSNERAKELSRISSSLRPERLRDPLINSFFSNQWNLFSSFGVWVYDPFFRSFCFLPFGYGWRSAYGYGFGRPIWHYNLPTIVYRTPPPSASIATKSENAKSDRGFADVVKRPDQGSPSKVSDEFGLPSLRGPRRPTTEPRNDIPMKVRSIPTREPVVDIPLDSSGKKP